MSSGKPPLLIDSTTLSLPSTMSAPVRPRRIRSSPSRSAVPGATAARVALSRSSSVRSTGVTTAPCPPTRRPPRLVPCGRSARGESNRGDPGPRRAGTSSAATTAPATSATSMTRSPSGTGPEPRTPRGVNATRNPSLAASASRRGIPGHRPQLAGQSDLAERDRLGRQGGVDDRARDAERDGEVGGRLAEAHTADRRHVGVAAADRHSGAAFEDGHDHGDAARVEAVRGPARGRDVARRDERLDLGDERAPALQGDGDAGARRRSRRGWRGTIRSGRRARRCRRRRGRSSRPRRSGRSGSSPPGPAAAGSAGRPRTGPRRRRGARGCVDRRSSRPWSRGRRGGPRCRGSWPPG